MARRLGSAIWADLPVELKRPTDLGAYRRAMQRIVENMDESVGAVESTTREISRTVSSNAASSGTVTSVGLVLPTTEFSVTNSPITGSGSLTVTWKNQAANKLLASPVSGAAGAVSFRSLVDADVPNTVVRTSRTINTTAPLAGGGALSGNLILSIAQADTDTDGYLSYTDWNTFNSKLSTLPIASATVLGGVKVGSGLTITPEGVLSAPGDGYVLPTASSTVLGGVKVGSGLVITESGLLSVSDSSGNEADATYYIHEQTAASTQWLVRHDLGKVPTGILVVVGGEVIVPAITIGAAAATAYYTHDQATPATEWVINHGLADFPTGLMVTDLSGNVIDPGIDMDNTAPYQIRLYFSDVVAGKAYVSTGGAGYPVTIMFDDACTGKAYMSIGANRAPYIHTQTTASTEWVVNHGIGRMPTAIRALDSAGSVIDDTSIYVVESAPYTLTLRFSDPKTGTVYVS